MRRFVEPGDYETYNSNSNFNVDRFKPFAQAGLHFLALSCLFDTQGSDEFCLTTPRAHYWLDLSFRK